MQTALAPVAAELDTTDTCTCCGEHAVLHIRGGEMLHPSQYHAADIQLLTVAVA